MAIEFEKALLSELNRIQSLNDISWRDLLRNLLRYQMAFQILEYSEWIQMNCGGVMIQLLDNLRLRFLNQASSCRTLGN